MRTISAVFAVTSLVLIGKAYATPSCERLLALQLPDTTITKAEAVKAGSFKIPASPLFPASNATLPAHCRVSGSIKPTPDSDIRFEVWLPSSNWNHRYQQVGNCGLFGALQYGPMTLALQRGSATASADNGHVSADAFDATWSLGHPEKLIDFGSRAVHLTALAAQAIVQAYYSQKAARAYFSGCSEGGRESLMEAQHYPRDFDGYLVGAPAIDIPAGADIPLEWNAQRRLFARFN